MSLVVSTRAVRSVHRTHLAGAVTASVFLGFLILGALVPDVFTRFDPVEANSARSLIAPDGVHLFGTDLAGRDVFARVLYGARSSLFVGFGAVGRHCEGQGQGRGQEGTGEGEEHGPILVFCWGGAATPYPTRPTATNSPAPNSRGYARYS